MNCNGSKTVSSFYKLCVGWQRVLLRGQSNPLSHLLTSKSLFNININPHFGTCVKHLTQKQLLYLNPARKTSSQFLYLSPAVSFSSYDRSHNEDFKQKRKMGVLKASSRRKDWHDAEETLATIVDQKGVVKWEYDDWIELSEKLTVTTGSWEVLCMMYFFKTSNLPLGLSLMDFVLSKSEESSKLLVTYFVGLLGITSYGDKAQEETMKSYYDDLISKSDILDSYSMEVLTNGLCYTRYYKECLKLIAMAKEANTLRSKILLNTLRGGLINHDHELCTFVLDHFDDATASATFLQHFNQLTEKALQCGNKEGLKLFLSFLRKVELVPKQEQVLAATENFERYEPGMWQANLGFVNYNTGKCSVCKHTMEETIITNEEFKAIQSAFLDEVIVNDNIFYKSTPKEVKAFIKFVKDNGPFDVVVDGLNLLYNKGIDRFKKGRDPYMISVIESYFTEQGCKMLILGNKQMQRVLKNMKHKSSVFITDTTKADDAFFLYAALHSGHDTLIISGDKLRDHKSRLSPKLRPIFNRWLKTAVVFDFYIDNRKDDIVLKRRSFDLGPVEDEAGWHLPFDDTTDIRPFGRNGVVCLRHGTKNFVPDKERQYGHNRNRNKRHMPQHRSQFSEFEKQRDDSTPWYKQ